jgi:hypothetical protein
MRCAEQDCLPCGGGDLRRAVGCQGRTRPGVRPRLPSLKITQYLQIVVSSRACTRGATKKAASLLQLIRDVVGRSRGTSFNLLIFIDCLVVLDILIKWGLSDYYPRPKEIVHFDVIYQLLVEPSLWSGTARLVKVKSHSGCLLNERAGEEAERGRTDERPEICS